jgi:hypothetical protein
MTAEQIVGWFLIAAGVFLIIGTLYFSWQIFSGKTAPPEIFKASSLVSTKSQIRGAQDLQAQMQELFSQALKEQLQGFFPADSTVKLFNLLSWSLFAGILLFGGGQIAGIGIRLLQSNNLQRGER